METNSKPVHEIRIGPIKGTIWANHGSNGIRHSATISRVYKLGEEWKHTGCFRPAHLLPIAKVADQVHTWICEHRN